MINLFIRLEYDSNSDYDSGIVSADGDHLRSKKKNQNDTPIKIINLNPIQMPHVDINELKEGRKQFTKEEWMDVLLRSIGMEPDMLDTREKWLLLTRMLPLVENNFNLCELGPRSTGKSHLYKEISPNSILVSGGQTTVANLFYNMGRKTVGLVGLWDCVAFDEVAGINFKDKDGIQIMKDYMASGSFARGKEEKAASASMVFVGNINQSVDSLLKTSSLFDPFPAEMGTDTAFLDRIHCYLPGWEVPKFRPEHFTDDYGFITDYLAEFIRELRKEQFGDALDKYFRLGKNLNQRDTIAVRKMVGGYIKLLYPDGEYTKEEIEEILQIADGIMVARGDMGVEIPAEDVPHYQKEIIKKCNATYKPVITATQMLDSMIRNPRPTRAEVTDVANAIYDGTDVVMLSGETANGKYPLEALKMMVKIAERTEQDIKGRSADIAKVHSKRSISSAVCNATVQTADNLNAKAIVCPTISGFTARLTSKLKPNAEIIGCSPYDNVLRKMQIYWGVRPLKTATETSTDKIIEHALVVSEQAGYVEEGDTVIVSAGIATTSDPSAKRGLTNTMRVVTL